MARSSFQSRTLRLIAPAFAIAVFGSSGAFGASPYLGELDENEAVLIDFDADEPVILAAGPKATPLPPTPPVAPMPSLAPLARLAALPHLGLPRGAWYGVSLRCSDCSIGRDDEEEGYEWRFGEAPEIVDIEVDSPADRAGVRRGDVLTHVDGVPITKREAGRRFGTAKVGDSVRWTVRLGNKTREVTVVAGKRPGLDGKYWEDVHAELRAAQEALAAQQEKMQQSHMDAEQYEDLRETQERLAQMARSLADLERQRAARAPRALLIDPNELVVMPDDEQIRIVDRNMIRDTHRLRYSGKIGDSKVEVRGTSAVVVTEEKNGDLVIDTPDASIRVKK